MGYFFATTPLGLLLPCGFIAFRQHKRSEQLMRRMRPFARYRLKLRYFSTGSVILYFSSPIVACMNQFTAAASALTQHQRASKSLCTAPFKAKLS